MADPEIKIKGGVGGAKRVLAAINDASEIKEVRQCLRDLFIYELGLDIKGGVRYKAEYEKRIGAYAQAAGRSDKSAK